MKLVLPADPSVASFARRAVREACAGVTVDLDALLLCTSELVTNALLHGAPPMELEIMVQDCCIRIAVRDAGTGLVERRGRVRPDTLSGRGLGIVEMLSAAWGCDPSATGKVTWFEFDRAR